MDIKGIFTLKEYDSERNLLNITIKENLVVDSGKQIVAKGIAGQGCIPIDKFVLGTAGHVGTDLMNPKETDSTRIQTFSEELDEYAFALDFTPDALGGPAVLDDETEWVGPPYAWTTFTTGDPLNISEVSTSLVQQEFGWSVIYTFTIYEDRANNPVGLISTFTEAALYAGGDLFSHLTFPVRTKDNSIIFEASWEVNFS